MALLLHHLVQEHLPARKRQTPKGWWVFNAPCCYHRGHNADTRSRGNLLMSPDGSMVINCYNCGFKTGYKGGDIGSNLESWLHYLGVPKNKIQEAKLEILSKKLSGEMETLENSQWMIHGDFKEISLPLHSAPIESWLEREEVSEELITCVNYLTTRGRAVAGGWSYYWSPSVKHDLNHRILIPFYHHGKIVGWTGRYFGKPPAGIPRYYNSDLPTGYLFNGDTIENKNRKYVLITEGPFDAIAIDGVAVLGSKLNKQQILWLNSGQQEKIIVPDRQEKNQDLIDTAIEQGWSVSFPDWEDGIKDAADASKKYGKLYTISTLISARTKSRLQIDYKRQLLKG